MKEISTHPSGLQVISFHMPHMNSVSVGIWVGAGGRNESEAQSGISHFIEHLLFKGTPKRDGKEISQAIEGLGGVLNAFTGEEYTCYYAKVLAEYFDVTFDVLWDMVDNEQFDADKIEREKPVVKEEINMYQDLPAQYVHDLLSQIMWPDQPLGRMLIGTVDTIDALDNKSIVDYKRRYYKLHNIVVAVAGNIEHKKVFDLVCKYIDGKVKQEKVPDTLEVVERQQSPVCYVSQKDTEQVHLALGVRAFHREHEDRYILKVLNTIFGGNMSSRLFQVIREKHGLAYSVNSSVDRYKDTGSLVISAGTEEHKLYKAVELILREMDLLCKGDVTADELERGKKFAIGQLALGLEKTMNIMMWLGESLLCSKKVVDIETIFDSIQKVTIDDITRVATMLFKNNSLNLAVIGPVTDEKKLIGSFSF
ncbi:MAG: pitrilysin family protein [Candidatus Auribacterota bacterium]|jgi:predicted Zn-dependent peptidase|nr:pitrilysin family protein [Candidatus Auribacterota bacterium]